MKITFKIRPPLVQSAQEQSSQSDMPKTIVDMALEDIDGDKTRVTVTHSGWDLSWVEQVREFYQQLSKGWKGAVLPKLAEAAAA